MNKSVINTIKLAILGGLLAINTAAPRSNVEAMEINPWTNFKRYSLVFPFRGYEVNRTYRREEVQAIEMSNMYILSDDERFKFLPQILNWGIDNNFHIACSMGGANGEALSLAQKLPAKTIIFNFDIDSFNTKDFPVAPESIFNMYMQGGVKLGPEQYFYQISGDISKNISGGCDSVYHTGPYVDIFEEQLSALSHALNSDKGQGIVTLHPQYSDLSTITDFLPAGSSARFMAMELLEEIEDSNYDIAILAQKYGIPLPPWWNSNLRLDPQAMRRTSIMFASTYLNQKMLSNYGLKIQSIDYTSMSEFYEVPGSVASTFFVTPRYEDYFENQMSLPQNEIDGISLMDDLRSIQIVLEPNTGMKYRRSDEIKGFTIDPMVVTSSLLGLSALLFMIMKSRSSKSFV